MKAGDQFHIPHEGERWTIVRSAIHDGGDFIADVAIEGKKGPPMHLHEHEDEAIEIFEGTVTFFMPDGPVTLRAGDTLMIPRGTRHTFKSGPDGFRGRATYNGRRFEELIAQLQPGDKRGFVRMVQHMRRTNWTGSRLTNPLLRGFLAIVGAFGSLMGIRPRSI